MTHVVTEACIKCKYTDCVAVCPVDCFHEGANMLVIDPVECIDCGACVDVCPTEAIAMNDDETCAVVDASLCTGCGSCVDVCPVSAIEMK